MNQNHKLKIVAIGVCLGTALNISLFAQTNGAPTESERLQKLEQAVQQLQEEKQALKQEVDELKARPTVIQTTTNYITGSTVQTNRIPFILPRGNESKMMLEGILQANGEFGDPSSFEGKLAGGSNRVYPRFRLRRARIGVIGEFWDDFDYRLEGDFQQSDGFTGSRSGFSGTDLFINYHKLPEANFKVGQFIAPFGYEMLLPDVGPNLILLTAERSLATVATVPERQVGAQLWGKPFATVAPAYKDFLSYALGIFNGNNRNVTVNDSSSFMYAGRVDSVPVTGKIFGEPLKWRLGADAFQSRDAANTLLDQVGNLQLNPADGSLGAYSTHPSDERLAWGVDQTLTLGPVELTAEYIADRVRFTTPSAGLSRFTAHGYYVQPSWFFWGKKLQLVGKWENFNPGQAAHDTIKSATGGLNWYIYGQNVVAMADFIHTWSDYRQDHPGTGKDEFNELLLRLELFY